MNRITSDNGKKLVRNYAVVRKQYWTDKNTKRRNFNFRLIGIYNTPREANFIRQKIQSSHFGELNGPDKHISTRFFVKRTNNATTSNKVGDYLKHMEVKYAKTSWKTKSEQT